jgi:hypothetical protein
MAQSEIFVGRTEAASRLQAVLTGECRATAQVTVCSIEGAGGIGKTALLNHVLRKVNLDALKYLCLRTDGGCGSRDATPFGLVGRLIEDARPLPPPDTAPGGYFSQARSVLRAVADVRNECAAEFDRIVPADQETQGEFRRALDAVMAFGEAINSLAPGTKRYFDCSEKSRQRIEGAVRKMESLRPTLRWVGGIFPDWFGVGLRNAVKANALNVVADALLTDLSAILAGYQRKDVFKPLPGKQRGIDRLLLVIDDYESLGQPLGEFLVNYLLRALGNARFRTVALILGRDQLQNTHPGWDQHLATMLLPPIHLTPLSRGEMDQLAGLYGVTSAQEKERVWADTLGYPYYVQLWVEEMRAGGRTAVMLKRFHERVTRWMTEQQQRWLEVALFLERVDKETLSWYFDDCEQVDQVYRWFESEGSVRDTQAPVFKVKEYLRTRLLDYLRVKDPAKYRRLEQTQRAIKT